MFCLCNHDKPGRSLIGRAGIFLLLLFASSLFAESSIENQDAEAWLVTYGPGEIYWQRFGHNAIWIRDRELRLDHVFNFGFFDFEQENFFLRFLQGRMLYFSAARPAREEFAGYIDENRSIRAQRLDLSADQVDRLSRFLLHEVRPENREYLYDYYRNNCSTRVRDALDFALDGLLKAQTLPIPARQNWRDHTRRLTVDDFWLYLGLETGLGATVDQDINRWDEMFIPAELAESVGTVSISDAGRVRPLVLEDVLLYESSFQSPAVFPVSSWLRYLLFSLAVIMATWLLCRVAPAGAIRAVSRTWLVMAGVFGCILLFFWFGTDHLVARVNLNLLVFNPLYIFIAFWKGQEKIQFSIISGFAVLALLMTMLPPGQYNLDVIAAFLPLNLAAAWSLVRAAGDPRPGVIA
jgi:hypothetical protein